MKNYTELQNRARAFEHLQNDLRELVSRYDSEKGWYDNPELEVEALELQRLDIQINVMEKLLEHLDKLF